ncbi:hypothetical protein Tco_0916750 [Tanacetum coccineum]
MIITTITTPTITTTTTTKITVTTTKTTVTMITTNLRIEGKKLLGLILPKDTMETFLYVQDAPCITPKFALSNVNFANTVGYIQTRGDSLRERKRTGEFPNITLSLN